MKRLLIILIAIVFALTCVEFYFRGFRPQRTIATFDTQARCYLSDPITYVRFQPDSTCVFTNSEYNTSARINSQGFRNNSTFSTTKPEKTVRIAAIGDSYTFGQGVNDGVPFPNQLETILKSKGINSEVINSGMPGSGVDWYYLTFLHYIKPLRPHMVIVGLYIGNDFSDLSYFSWATQNSDHLPTKLSAPFEHIDPDGARRSMTLPFRYRLPVIRTSHVAQWISDSFFNTTIAPQVISLNGSRCMLDPNCHDLDPEIQTIVTLLSRMKKEGETHSTQIAVVLIPWEAQLPRNITQNTGMYIPNETNRTSFYNTVDAHLQNAGIPTIRILDAFSSYSGDTPLLYKVDGHWTATGHKVAAEFIANNLLKRGFIKPSPPEALEME